jgi:hypothetical protein
LISGPLSRLNEPAATVSRTKELIAAVPTIAKTSIGNEYRRFSILFALRH